MSYNTSTKRQRVDPWTLRKIHSLALRATNGQNLRTPRKFYYAAKSSGCLTLAFCVTSTKQRRTEPNVGGDRPRQPAVDGGSRTLGPAPRGVQMLLGDRYPGCAARPWATMFNRVAVVVRAIAKFWNLELGLPGEASAGLVFVSSNCCGFAILRLT